MQNLFLSGAQLVISIISAAIVAYLSVWLFDRATRGIDEWAELRKGNIAVGIVLGAVIVGVAIILKPALIPVSLNLDTNPANQVPYQLLTQGLQILIGLFLSVISIGLSLWLFTRLTGSIDEWAEIARGNAAIAIMLAGVILATALIASTALDSILGLILR
jgi:uncharacterized membrane protein YjfL (UPF0719 family)